MASTSDNDDDDNDCDADPVIHSILRDFDNLRIAVAVMDRKNKNDDDDDDNNNQKELDQSKEEDDIDSKISQTRQAMESLRSQWKSQEEKQKERQERHKEWLRTISNDNKVMVAYESRPHWFHPFASFGYNLVYWPRCI